MWLNLLIIGKMEHEYDPSKMKYISVKEQEAIDKLKNEYINNISINKSSIHPQYNTQPQFNNNSNKQNYSEIEGLDL